MMGGGGGKGKTPHHPKPAHHPKTPHHGKSAGGKPKAKATGKSKGKVAPVQSSGGCFMTSGSVNMRSSPCGSSIITTVPSGSLLQSGGGAAYVGSCYLGSYPFWQPVSYGGRSGYIAASLLSGAACSNSGGGGNNNPPPPSPPRPPAPAPAPSGGSVVQNSIFKSLSPGAQAAVLGIAKTCGATVTPVHTGPTGHCDMTIDKDYSSCFQAARTQSYLSNFEFIWHPGVSHCSTVQHLHILEGYHSHGIDKLYPAGPSDSINVKPDPKRWGSCQWLAEVSSVANWCCFQWY